MADIKTAKDVLNLIKEEKVNSKLMKKLNLFQTMRYVTAVSVAENQCFFRIFRRNIPAIEFDIIRSFKI